MNRFRRKATVGAVLAGCAMVNMPSVMAHAVPGGTLDPLAIPKYVTPLVIPPVLHDDGGIGMSVEVALRQITQQVLPAGFPATPLWAYGDPANPATFNNPGFTIEVTKDLATEVTWINDLVDDTGAFLPHIIHDAAGNPIVDQTLHLAAPNQDCLGILSPDLVAEVLRLLPVPNQHLVERSSRRDDHVLLRQLLEFW